MRIREAAEAEGYTQTKLERKLIQMSDEGGIPTRFTQGYLSRMIYGQRGNSSIDPLKLQAISDLLHVGYEWLATGRGPMRVTSQGRAAHEEAAAIARSLNAREDAIVFVLAGRPAADEHDIRYWVDRILAESDGRRRAGVPEHTTGDVRRMKAKAERAWERSRKRGEEQKQAEAAASRPPPANPKAG